MAMRDARDQRDEYYSLYGEFGVTSDEIPALSRAQQTRIVEQRDQWEREQRTLWEQRALKREQIMRKVEKLYRWHALSGLGYDLLQAEFGQGLLPDVYWDDEMGGYLVWSAYERRRWTLYGWEHHARELLAAQQTTVQVTVLRQTPRPWAPIFDSKLDPQRRTPQVAARPTPRLNVRDLIDDEAVQWEMGDLDYLEMGQPAPATRRLRPEER